MMKRPVLFILLLCCMTLVVPAQNKRTTPARKPSGTQKAAPAKIELPVIPDGLFSAQELEVMRVEALKQIELTSLLLSETNASTKTLLNRLNLITQQLQTRKKVISILEQEIAEIDRKIKTMTTEIELLDKDLKLTKENYAKSIQNQRQEYRSAQHKLLMILSANDLSQSYRRMRYLREYANWQKQEANRIGVKQTDVVRRKTELESSRQEKQDLLAQRENENKKMVSEEQQQQKEVRDLNNKQKDLQRILDQKRKEADALNRQIEWLITEDIKNSEKNRTEIDMETKSTEAATSEAATSERATSERATSERTTSEKTTSEEVTPEKASSEKTTPRTGSGTTETKPSTTKGSYVLLESEAKISKDFMNNKGRLPFPLTGKYTIVSSFGEHQHQDLTHVRTNNNGIDIQTTVGSEACAIFKGVVTRVFVMPGFNNNVIIRHGDYLTVYSNLSNVYVKAGDTVAARQAIGKIFTDTAKGNETILHFQLWNERTKLNPAAWIK